jgi:hypothetical protein
MNKHTARQHGMSAKRNNIPFFVASHPGWSSEAKDKK